MRRNDIKVRRELISEQRISQYRDFNRLQRRYERRTQKRSFMRLIWMILFLMMLLLIFFALRTQQSQDQVRQLEKEKNIQYTQAIL